MASRRAWKLRDPIIATVVAGSIALYPTRYAHAEAPAREGLRERKPIYSDNTFTATPRPKSSSDSPSNPKHASPSATPSSPSPTDRLTEQIRRGRIFLYEQSCTAEDGVNRFMSSVLRHETSFTNTIASLAPSAESGEQLLPGAIYVLVATMTGSIITRNRGIFLRSTFPLALGVTAGWALIPVTMRNIADLSWKYEKRVPAISNTHAQISGFAREAWRQTRDHASQVGSWADEQAVAGRQRLESWVGDGK